MVSVILGARRVSQLEDNLASMDFTLPDEMVERLDEVSAFAPRYPQWMQPMAQDEAFAKALG